MKSKRSNMLMTVTTMMGALHKNFTEIGLMAAREANADYMNSSRGKGRGGGLSAMRIFSKSTNARKLHQGAKECARRIKQAQ